MTRGYGLFGNDLMISLTLSEGPQYFLSSLVQHNLKKQFIGFWGKL
jgi:hypothetical protein